jgi:hypothetical protein
VLEHGQDDHGTPRVVAPRICIRRLKGAPMASNLPGLFLDAASQLMYTSYERRAGAVMSFSKPLMEFPAAIEAKLSHRMATNETGQPTIGNSARRNSGCPKNCSFFDVRSRNVYENKQNVDKVRWLMPNIHVKSMWALRTLSAMGVQLRLSRRSVDSIKFKLFWKNSMRRSVAERLPRPGNFAPEATISMKNKGLTLITPNWPQADALDNMLFTFRPPIGGGKKGD